MEPNPTLKYFLNTGADDTLPLGQSPDQKDLIREMPEKTALYVEGAFRSVRDAAVVFFISDAEIVFDSLLDPDLHLSMRIRIQEASGYVNPCGSGSRRPPVMWIHADPDPKHCDADVFFYPDPL